MDEVTKILSAYLRPSDIPKVARKLEMALQRQFEEGLRRKLAAIKKKKARTKLLDPPPPRQPSWATLQLEAEYPWLRPFR